MPIGETVELPPFVVTKIADGPGWRYAAIPGFEIISQCSDHQTRAVVDALWRGPQLMLPEELRAKFSVPTIVVLFNQPPSRDFPQALGLAKKNRETERHWTNVIKRSIDDRESFALNLWGRDFKYSASFRFDVRTLLLRRTPAVPSWLLQGLFGEYGIYREGAYWDPAEHQKRVHVALWWSFTELNQLKMMEQERVEKNKRLSEREKKRSLFSQAEAYYLSNKPPAGPSPVVSFIPELATIFDTPNPQDGSSEPHRRASTVALFVRWGAFSPDDAIREQFWRFIQRALVEPVTESMFMECFGLSYAEVRDRLSWFLPYALEKQASAPVEITGTPAYELRDATHGEFARMIGEWQRIEARVLGPQYPELAKTYREQAEKTFEKAFTFKNAQKNPRILASMGLLAVESQKLARGHELLEAAILNGVEDPSVLLETARLRWAAQMTDEKGTLSPEDSESIAELLLKAERQKPAMPSVYLLLAKLAADAKSAPPSHVAALERGLVAFPRNAEMQHRLKAALVLSHAQPGTAESK
jgi:hypothetical protein